MCKRLRITLITLAITAFLLISATPLEARSLLLLNGDDWTSWNTDTKRGYMTGYLLATWTLTEIMIHGGTVNDGEPYEATLRALSLRELSNIELIARLDEYYRRHDNAIPLWMALFDLGETEPYMEFKGDKNERHNP